MLWLFILPVHLPRIEVGADIDDKTCPCCQGDPHQIGEDQSERLDMIPAQYDLVLSKCLLFGELWAEREESAASQLELGILAR